MVLNARTSTRIKVNSSILSILQHSFIRKSPHIVHLLKQEEAPATLHENMAKAYSPTGPTVKRLPIY
jgi:hypothetical protein